ncbi:hypothetical protein LIA77_03470 [Sarocladium implicatum]|nr:hypothetical protein LIA77_03470 [Sarocladium implicatum]
MSHPTTEDFPPPERQGTDSSHYSCTGLEADHPQRYLKASEVRRQVQEIPNKRVRKAANGPTSRRYLAEYPVTFRNDEELDLKGKRMHHEYPVLAQGSWDPNGPDGNQGAARIIYNKSNKAVFDVTYHDPRKSDNNLKNATIAPYRLAYYNRQGGSSK